MSNPVLVRTTSYQHRAYLAEASAQADIEANGALLGWNDHADLAEFHERFAPSWFDGRPIPTLRQGTGSSSSRYYASRHEMKVLKRDRHILSYCHELAHAATSKGRGNGHHPRWAGMYVAMVKAIDPRTAKLLAAEFRRQRLTVTLP
jgi:hypothetical protein